MKFNQLGRTGLYVSEICLGTMTFGGNEDAGIWKAIGSLPQAEVNAIMEKALAAGVNFFDTADVYSFGASEERLGQSLVDLGVKRSDVVLATKVFGQMGPGPNDRGASRGHIMDSVESSLDRLQTDHIDLCQIHGNDTVTPIDETLRALDDLVTQGKVRYLGNSNYTGWQIADADWTAAGQSRFVSAQNLYSLLERDVEREVLPACEHFGLGFLPYFPLASGLLSGKYQRGEPPPEGTRLAAWGARGQQAMSDANFDKVEALTKWAGERGHTILELAFAWLLGHDVVSSVIAGATTPEQVKTNAATADWVLTPEEVDEVGKLVA